MAAETVEAPSSARAQESRPESLNQEVQQLYSDTSTLNRGSNSATSDTRGDDKQSQTLDFNTGDLFRQNTQFLQSGDLQQQQQQQFIGLDGKMQTGSGEQTQQSGFGEQTQQSGFGDGTQKSDFGEQMKESKPDQNLKDRLGGTTRVRKGEDVSAIAQRKLGEGATEGQKEALTRSIESINGIEPGAKLDRGRELKVPGVNENGDFVHSENGVDRLWSPVDGRTETRTPDGTRTTNYKIGDTKIEQPNGDVLSTSGDTTTLRRADGTSVIRDRNGELTNNGDGVLIERGLDGRLRRVDGEMHGPYQRKSDGNGGTVERGAGGRPEQNFSMVQSKDGRTEVFDRGPDGKDRVSGFMNDSSVEAERKGTMERAERHITDPAELARFKADMVRFEGRAQERGMEPGKVTDTYKAINRMFDGGPNSKLPQGERNLLAQQVMGHAATPTSIDQGKHNTCSVAALESNIYTKNPDKAAALVADVALTGKFKSADGKELTVPEKSLKPDYEASNRAPEEDQRDHASQLFQVTAVNLLYQQKYTLPWTYEQKNVNPSETRGDQGERDRLFGFTYGSDFKGLNGQDIENINERITGKKDPDLFLPNASTPQEMGQQLESLQREGKLPAMMWVHTGNPPFNHETDRSGGHFINVTGYDAAKREVSFDNQWGTAEDHISKPQSLVTVWQAGRTPRPALK